MEHICRADGETKKKVRPSERRYTTALFLHNCLTAGFSIADLKQITVGMAFGVMIERGNDSYEYKQLATQEDFDRF